MPAKSPLRVLFVGNSYTYFNDLPAMLRTLAGAGRDSIVVHVASVTEGGASLRTHWNDRTIARIRERAWDYVVLQEQSLTPIERRPQFVDYGRRFAAEIRSAGAQVVLYLTWAREQRPADQALLDSAYLGLAEETGALVVPVGAAWQELRNVRGLPSLFDEDGSHPSPFGSFVAATVFHRVLFGALPPVSSGTRFGIQAQTVPLVHQAVEAAVARLPRE